MNADFTASLVFDPDCLERLRPAWNRLLHASTSDSPFLTWEWVSTWWKSYGAGRDLWLVTVEHRGELVGLAPLYRQRHRWVGGVTYRALALIGDGSADSDYLDVIAATGQAGRVLSLVAAFLLERRREWDVFLFREVPEGAASLATFRRLLAEDGGCRWDEEPVECAFVTLPPTWDEYLQSLRPRMRTKMRSLMRRLEGGRTVRFEGGVAPDDLASRLDSVFAHHGRRWQMKGEHGVFVGARKRAFYTAMAQQFLAQGWLRLYSLAVDGAWVAHQVCLEYQGGVYLLQEGFDPDWADAEVGNVLRSYVFRDCIERKVSVYDFLGGVSFHKLSWGADIKRSLRVTIGAPTARSRIVFAAPRARAWLKHQVKRVVSPDTSERLARLRPARRGGRPTAQE